MKPPEQCADLTEVRAAIDTLDRELLALLGRRAGYVHAAARFKPDAAAVRAPERVRAMLAQRRAWAADEGLDPEVVAGLFTRLIEYFTRREQAALEARPASRADVPPAGSTATSSPPACTVVGDAGSYEGKQGLTYLAGISAESVGAQGICMHMLRMPPGARAKAHLHAAHETAIYLLSGRAAMWYGERLEHHLAMGPGEYLYIPAGVPHLPYNPGPDEAVAILARTDPNEQESVALRPELEALRGPAEPGPAPEA